MGTLSQTHTYARMNVISLTCISICGEQSRTLHDLHQLLMKSEKHDSFIHAGEVMGGLLQTPTRTHTLSCWNQFLLQQQVVRLKTSSAFVSAFLIQLNTRE